MIQNILFVGHDANRAGSQILLLRFLKLLKSYGKVKFSVLLKHDGPLVQEYESIAPTYLLHQEKTIGLKNQILQKIKSKLGQTSTEKSHVWQTLASQKFDLIVSNTFTNGDIFEELSQLNIPIYSYIHELRMGIEMYNGSQQAINNTLRCTQKFIACANSVKQNLMQQFEIPEQKIDILCSLLPESAQDYHISSTKVDTLKQELGIPQDAFVVGGMGTIDLRKGTDLFVQLAHILQQQNIYFLWIGGSHSQNDFKIFSIDSQRLGLHNIRFVEAVSNPLDYLAVFDIFALTSREDPYPLVVLEAALLQKPMVCFENAGGAQDLIETDAGIIVPYLSLNAMANAIVSIKENPACRLQMGKVARKKVLQRHATEKAFHEFLTILHIS
ncbi:glycosyltransferase family 4 protein [Flectobacillus longus]|uniref:glycosyltransferase family 4 protein n=1 Tax=Flectobacillus longus TaxID=2984207 RepID=UPI0024B77D96|nr:glycosyltransferase family 4 protein [Flectobacillus longus]MDI9880164.1 glycosyltransferase family 4 protein [Flectobacillus longus]